MMPLDASKMDEDGATEDPQVVANRKSREALELGQRIFEATQATGARKESLKAALLGEIVRDKMVPLYDRLCPVFGWPADVSLRTRLQAENDATLAVLDAAITGATEREGPVEVGAAMIKKAQFLGSTGDVAGALKAYKGLPEKSLSTGGKADVAMAGARLCMAHSEWDLAKGLVAEAKTLNDKGGDWDRKNRLKVYDGLLSLQRRDLKRANESLLDSVSTFTASELLSYETCMFYTVIAALKTLPRPQLKKKMVDSPDVAAVLSEQPGVSTLLHAFYEGRYAEFLRALHALQPRLAGDRFTAPHAQWMMRELRIGAYAQFLESYKSVSLAGMAAVFGVGAAFLDADLARLIAGGRVAAKIDAVNGIIESSRHDLKNSQYLEVLKQGDALLNKLSRLARMIAV